MTYSEINSLKYKLENPFLLRMSRLYGMSNLVAHINACIRSGFGYIDNQRIDRNFMSNLSANDRLILQEVSDWLKEQYQD